MKIVIKIGSSLVTSDSEIVDLTFKKISNQISKIIKLGHDYSCFIRSNCLWDENLEFKDRPNEIEKLQALSAVGQMGLMLIKMN